MRPSVPFLEQPFEDWNLPPTSGKKLTQIGPINSPKSSPYLWLPERTPGRE
jgi:hypothetical protein